jgi:bifunctional non-homologous end joining protein LigD
MSLTEYRRKRDFRRTPEPAGSKKRPPTSQSFTVQKHAARRLHYDFRLELDGVLKSWAVPKGPSLDPSEKRLAVAVEDHPLEYGAFEGTIPAGEYGGGTVLLWDTGVWHPEGDPREGLRRGKLSFILEGQKLRGRWTLVRSGGRRPDSTNWLLLKRSDQQARRHAEFDVLAQLPNSVASGQSIEQIAAQPDRVWSGGGQSEGDKRASKIARKPFAGKRRKALKVDVLGARRAPMPSFVPPALARLVDNAPEGDGWLHEIKFDGYRLMCLVAGGKARLMTRNENDWTHRFRAIAEAAARLPVDTAVIDGEAVVLLPNGTSSFQALQNVLGGQHEGQLAYQCFDLLYLDGYDLRSASLLDRKAKLRQVLAAADDAGPLRYTEHRVNDGPAFHAAACELGLEGIVSKRSDRPYPKGRSDEWLKSKCIKSQEFVIGGFTDSTAARRSLGALLLGFYDDQRELRYAGRVGTGFSDRVLGDLRRRLVALTQTKPPFANPPRAGRATHWVRPQLVAQVRFADWTSDGLVRHASFDGLREDKPAEAIGEEEPMLREKVAKATREAKPRRATPKKGASDRQKTSDRADVAGVRLTHPDRVLYAEQGVTKLGLAAFYDEIADQILPHIVRRPLSLVRCPDGQGKKCFYQKHARPGTPDALERIEIEESGKRVEYLMVNDLAGLVSLVQLGVLEIHPWGATASDLAHPDRLIVDIDPGEGVSWARVVAAAREIRQRLDELRLTSFVKTTGGKGLHVVAPLRPRADWQQLKQFARALVDRMVADSPKQFTASMSKSARTGKIFIDYLRNDRGATAVAPYSTRARPNAPVSVPVSWDELGPALRPDHFGIANLPRRLKALRSDPWAGFFQSRQSLTKTTLKRGGVSA